VESFGGRLRDELLAMEAFTTLLEVQVLVEDWRIEHNTVRPHSALGYLTPPTTPRPGPPPIPHAHSRWTNNRGVRSRVQAAPAASRQPPVASPVGANAEILGRIGAMAPRDDGEWFGTASTAALRQPTRECPGRLGEQGSRLRAGGRIGLYGTKQTDHKSQGEIEQHP
jgi:Integrase core domain